MLALIDSASEEKKAVITLGLAWRAMVVQTLKTVRSLILMLMEESLPHLRPATATSGTCGNKKLKTRMRRSGQLKLRDVCVKRLRLHLARYA